jgi:hypothetical protein
VKRFPSYRCNGNSQAQDCSASTLLASVNLKQATIAPINKWDYGKFQIINMSLKYLKPKGAPLMNAEKEKLDRLAERIDELLAVMKDVSEDLKTVSASLKSLAVSQITTKPPAPTPTFPAPKTTAPSPASVSVSTARLPASTSTPASAKSHEIADIRMKFSEDLENMLSFEDKGDYVMIKPKQFLGSENFAKIASTVRGIGGEYISAGRESHFRVYKNKT